MVVVNAPATALVGRPYSATITATGGTPPFTWGAVSALPGWMKATVSGATLTLSGTPDLAGQDFPYGQVNDSYFAPQPGYWQVHLTVSYAAIATSCPANQATAGQPYLGAVTATGGDGSPFTWSVSGIPPGLTGTANGGTFAISGTPDATDVLQSDPPAPGRFVLGVTVSDDQISINVECVFPVNP